MCSALPEQGRRKAGGAGVVTVAVGVGTHLVAPAGQTRVPLGQDALHPQEKGPLDLVLWERGKAEVRGEPRAPPPLRDSVRGRAGQVGGVRVVGGGTRRAVYFTLHKVRVVGLVGREHRRHLIVVGGVDVLVNAIAGQLYL